jgi:predicted DNA-binding ribbon-helix-helix protein
VGTPGDDDRNRLSDAPKKRSVAIAGHRTSFSLEEPYWRDLAEVARRRGISLSAVVAQVDQGRRGNLSSALRLFVRDCYVRGELGPRAEPE